MEILIKKPLNNSQKWKEEEDILLLEEINKNIDIDTIANNHNRTKGAINSRKAHIVYQLYLKNISINEIIEKTKLNEVYIKKIIDKQKEISKPINYSKIECDVIEIKNEIKDMKNMIKELIEMSKAIYEFEEFEKLFIFYNKIKEFEKLFIFYNIYYF